MGHRLSIGKARIWPKSGLDANREIKSKPQERRFKPFDGVSDGLVDNEDYLMMLREQAR